MKIGGLQKTTLIDFPGKVAATVFTVGCNFRCPYCYNISLVKDTGPTPEMPLEEFLSFLEKRKKVLDGVCITGGEPTLHSDLPKLIDEIKSLGLEVKLDTNGSNPEMLGQLIKEKKPDYIAMDIKAPLEKYGSISRVQLDKEKIKKSVELIKNSGIEYEFRSTVVPGLFTKEDAKAIGEWLKGAKAFFIQQFRPMDSMLDSSLKKVLPFSREELEEFKKTMEPFFEKVEIRGAE